MAWQGRAGHGKAWQGKARHKIMKLKHHLTVRWALVGKRVKQWFWPFWIFTLSFVWIYEFITNLVS